ncbi:MAG: FAD-dependent monooxygenase [Ignavibacteriota bacterium]
MATKQYDVLIVGSGHSGGMAAKVLTEKGFSCLMLNCRARGGLSARSRRQVQCRTPLPRLQ